LINDTKETVSGLEKDCVKETQTTTTSMNVKLYTKKKLSMGQHNCVRKYRAYWKVWRAGRVHYEGLSKF